jgi:hypothetical protein
MCFLLWGEELGVLTLASVTHPKIRSFLNIKMFNVKIFSDLDDFSPHNLQRMV